MDYNLRASRVAFGHERLGELSVQQVAAWRFLVGTGVRPEEAFGAEWRDVDLEESTFTVRRTFAKGRLKPYPTTARSRRRVPLRASSDGAGVPAAARWRVVPDAGRRSHRHQQLPSPGVDAGVEGGGTQAQAHL
jgi:hypothetical protein